MQPRCWSRSPGHGQCFASCATGGTRPRACDRIDDENAASLPNVGNARTDTAELAPFGQSCVDDLAITQPARTAFRVHCGMHRWSSADHPCAREAGAANGQFTASHCLCSAARNGNSSYRSAMPPVQDFSLAAACGAPSALAWSASNRDFANRRAVMPATGHQAATVAPRSIHRKNHVNHLFPACIRARLRHNR